MEFNSDKTAYDLTKEFGQIGAISFCHDMILDNKSQINEMEFYNGEKLERLQDSMHRWAVVISKIKKGFPNQ